MKLRHVCRSLRFKVTLALLIPLLLILGTFSYLQYVRHRDFLLHDLQQSATHLGGVIEAGLRHAMLEQDFSEIQDIVNNVARREAISEVLLLNKENEIRIASQGKGVGTTLDLAQPACQICHRMERSSQPRSAVLTTQAGERVLRNCNPVENQEACHRCHDPQDKVLGVLITDISMAEMDRHLASDRQGAFLLSAAMTVLVVGAATLVMNRLVIGRLERFAETINAFTRGGFSHGHRVEIGRGDEIGVLADSFDQMAQGLAEKAELEQRLWERTDELQRLYGELQRLYRELQRKEAIRGQLLEEVITAQEEERKRVARELHDELAQTLAALTVSLKAAEDSLPAEMARAKEQLIRTKSLTDHALAEIRQLILELRPVMLDDLGLIPAIRWYAESHLESVGVRVDLTTDDPQRRVPPEIETSLFRILQEAINNVAKHARAKEVSIRLEFHDDQVIGAVEDDGQGFDVDELLGSDDRTRGLGLLGMQERAALLGGNLTFQSEPGVGTRIQAIIPTNMGVILDEQNTNLVG